MSIPRASSYLLETIECSAVTASEHMQARVPMQFEDSGRTLFKDFSHLLYLSLSLMAQNRSPGFVETGWNIFQ